jgi:hypothetical protein
MLLYQGLLDSRCPEGELDLPERQIILAFARQDLYGNGIRIEAYIMFGRPVPEMLCGAYGLPGT